MASEPDAPGPRSGTIHGSGAAPGHTHDLESVAQASDLEDSPASASPPGALPPHPREFDDLDEEGGGPVKTFLEHLEDLRWVIIKAGASVLIGMVICLVAAPALIKLLERPLKEADLLRTPSEGVVLLRLGTNVLWRLERGKVQWPVPATSNLVDSYQMVPMADGTNLIFVLQRDQADSDVVASRTAIKNYGPLEPFQVALQIALYGGIGLSLPFVLYFVGGFVVPALKRSEKRLVFPALGIGSILFVLGVVFCYFVMLQIALNAAVNFSRWMNFGADEWRADEYLGFVCKFLLGMGLAFELPVVLLSLVKLGLLDHQKLSKFRPYWIVVNMILSAVLTPPDPFSMFMMALPLQLLYEISVFIARLWGRRAEAR